MDEFDSDYLRGTPWGTNLSELSGAFVLAVLALVWVF